jgi:hypothetical protein
VAAIDEALSVERSSRFARARENRLDKGAARPFSGSTHRRRVEAPDQPERRHIAEETRTRAGALTEIISRETERTTDGVLRLRRAHQPSWIELLALDDDGKIADIAVTSLPLQTIERSL